MKQELVKIIKQSGVIILGRCIEAVLLLIVQIMITRILGVELYGQFIYVYTFIFIVHIITRFGIDQGIVAVIPRLKDKSDIKNIVNISITIVILISLIVIVIIFMLHTTIASMLLKRAYLQRLLMLQTPFIFIISFTEICRGIFQSIGEIKDFIIAKSFIIPIIQIVVILMMSIYSFSDKTMILVFSYYISWGIADLYLIRMLKTRNLVWGICWDFKKYKILFKFSIPLFLTGLIGVLLAKMDKYMIGYILSEDKVGIYNNACQIGLMTSFILYACNTVFAPQISLLYSNGEITKLSNLYKTVTKWLFAINILFFFNVLLLSKNMMSIFGADFIIGWKALIFISIGQVVNVSVGAVGYLNSMTKHPEYNLYTNIIMLMLNVIGNIYLIPRYGINGAAIATLVSVSLTNIVRMIMVYKSLKIHPFSKEYIKIILVGIVAFFIAFILKTIIPLNKYIQLFIIGGGFSSIYIFLYIKYAMSYTDKEMILSYKNRYR